MFLIGDFEKSLGRIYKNRSNPMIDFQKLDFIVLKLSLVLWHKAKKVRERQPEVREAIENICQTIVSSMDNCFTARDTQQIIEVMKRLGYL